MKAWIKEGTPWIWFTGGTVAISLLLVFGVLWLTAFQGLSYFWPNNVAETTFVEKDGKTIRVIGELRETEEVATRRLVEGGFNIRTDAPFVTRTLVKLGNRDITGVDFRWFPRAARVGQFLRPPEAGQGGQAGRRRRPGRDGRADKARRAGERAVPRDHPHREARDRPRQLLHRADPPA
jgi:ABC-type phosphate transport system auxiliary subunit